MRWALLISIMTVLAPGCAVKNSGTGGGMALPGYIVGNIDYQYDYGDAVQVVKKEYQYVICNSCLEPVTLQRQIKPLLLSIRMTTADLPSSTLSVTAISGKAVETTPPAPTPEIEQASPPVSSISKPEQATSSKKTCAPLTVYFDLNSSVVSESEKQKILSALHTLRGNEMYLAGYTCDIGKKEHNETLAYNRARSVAEILYENDIRPRSVTGAGKCCYRSKDKRLNRRVEIQCADDRLPRQQEE